jgi:hypothetical protein
VENQLRTKSSLDIADEKRRFGRDELDDSVNGGHDGVGSNEYVEVAKKGKR